MGQERVSARVEPTPAGGLTGPPTGVGLCLSGGGSRAMTAGLGQLRALHHLTTADGANLLSQIAAVSTVSGGSWLSVAWTFLPDHVSDADFLGAYVAPETITAASLTDLAPSSPGRNIGHDFSILHMVVELIGLRIAHRTPYNSMWQIIMGRHLLEPYGLYRGGSKAEPTTTFSLDETTKQQSIIEPNRELADAIVHLVTDSTDAERTPRAVLLCNTSIFVDEPGSELEFLAPVVFTPTTAGVISSPPDVTAVGAPVGGGTVDSFAFGSALASTDGETVEVLQDRQLALADIVGLSSAAFSQTVQDLGDTARKESPAEHRRFLRERLRIERTLGEKPSKPNFLHRIIDWFKSWALHRVLRELSPRALVPRYRYWPVGDPRPDPDVEPARFADGGSLENTGIASMLTRPNIDSIIACLNSEDELQATKVGVIKIAKDGTVTEEPGTRIAVASEVPYLFGYQSHNAKVGYVPFGDTPDEDLGADALFKHNHVFEAGGFRDLLRGLAAATGDDLRDGPAVFKQTLTTVENKWFGVAGGRQVTVVWVYLNPSDDWVGQLSSDVADIVNDTKNFPNYSTFDTQLTATEFSLLSHQTAWSIASDQIAGIFTGLFGTANREMP